MTRLQIVVLMLDVVVVLASLPVGWLAYTLLSWQLNGQPVAWEGMRSRAGRVSFALRMAALTSGLLLLGGLAGSLVEGSLMAGGLALLLGAVATGPLSFAGLFAGTTLATCTTAARRGAGRSGDDEVDTDAIG